MPATSLATIYYKYIKNSILSISLFYQNQKMWYKSYLDDKDELELFIAPKDLYMIIASSIEVLIESRNEMYWKSGEEDNIHNIDIGIHTSLLSFGQQMKIISSMLKSFGGFARFESRMSDNSILSGVIDRMFENYEDYFCTDNDDIPKYFVEECLVLQKFSPIPLKSFKIDDLANFKQGLCLALINDQDKDFNIYKMKFKEDINLDIVDLGNMHYRDESKLTKFEKLTCEEYEQTENELYKLLRARPIDILEKIKHKIAARTICKYVKKWLMKISRPKCPICFEILNITAYSANCGHTYCCMCKNSLMQNSRQCALCRNKINDFRRCYFS